ncbi:MAG: M23 family metallopeptidase, partial [Oscillospiraceae bacterium]
QSQQIGAVGTTGYSTGPHLHFQVSIENQPVNPELLY